MSRILSTGGHVWEEGMHRRGVCVVGGMHGRGCAWQGACMAGGGGMHDRGHMWHTVNERSVGMHPTGMHSCLKV